MEIYLAIIGTYLCGVFTIFLVIIRLNQKTNEDIKGDNNKWKHEVRTEFRNLKEKINNISNSKRNTVYKKNKKINFNNILGD